MEVERAEEAHLPAAVGKWVAEKAAVTTPADVYVCDGSPDEAQHLLALMERDGQAKRLPKYHNCWLTRSLPLLIIY